MAPDPELTSKVMNLRWKKGITLKEAWAKVKRPKKKPEKEKKPKKEKEKKPKKEKEKKPKKEKEKKPKKIKN